MQRNRNNTLIDNLSYSYYGNGNRLKSVTDASGNTAGYAPNTGQYLYDANANMTYDPSKKITVSYNPLNLPSLVEFDNSDFIEYTYSASGTKLRKTVSSWKTTTGGTTDYAGQFLYQDNELSCIFTPVGRMVPMQYNDETFWKHEYNLKDHLGNTRIVFAAHPHGQPELMQQTSYYPFGMTLQQQNFGGALNPPNKLLYNGKELQDDELAGLSLDWYDYGARMYDPAIGRFLTVDPMAGATMNLTPYHYCYSNPINFIDPSGMYAYDWNTQEYKNSKGEVVTWDEVKRNNFKEPVSIDLWGGLKKAWDSFWGISAKKTITGGNATPGEMSVAQDQLEASLVKMEKAEETIATVNEVLITSAVILTGYGVAAEGGIIVSRLYAVGADVVQQGLVKGDFSEVDFANSIIAGLGGKKALNELAKTLVDWKPGGALPTIKTDLISIGTEYGLRLTLNKVDLKGVKDPTLKFGVQLFKKVVRDEVQQPMINDIKKAINR